MSAECRFTYQINTSQRDNISIFLSEVVFKMLPTFKFSNEDCEALPLLTKYKQQRGNNCKLQYAASGNLNSSNSHVKRLSSPKKHWYCSFPVTATKYPARMSPNTAVLIVYPSARNSRVLRQLPRCSIYIERCLPRGLRDRKGKPVTEMKRIRCVFSVTGMGRFNNNS